MSNIYIIGVPRSGKTTLAKLIKERFNNVNQVSFEALRNGFIKTFPELDMGNRNSEARANILPGRRKTSPAIPCFRRLFPAN